MSSQARKSANRSSESYKPSWTPDVIENAVGIILDMVKDGECVLDLPTVHSMMHTSLRRTDAESNEDFFIAVWLLKNAGQSDIDWKVVAEKMSKTSQSVYQKPWTLINKRNKRGEWVPTLPGDISASGPKKRKRGTSATPKPEPLTDPKKRTRAASATPKPEPLPGPKKKKQKKKALSPTPEYFPVKRTPYIQPEVTPYLQGPSPYPQGHSVTAPDVSPYLQRPLVPAAEVSPYLQTAAPDNSPYVQRAAAKAAKKSSRLNRVQSDSSEAEDNDEDDEDYDPYLNKRKKPEKAKTSMGRMPASSGSLLKSAPKSSSSLGRRMHDSSGSVNKRKRPATVVEEDETKTETRARSKRRKKSPPTMGNLGYNAADLLRERKNRERLEKERKKKKRQSKRNKIAKKKNSWSGSESDTSEATIGISTRSQTRDSEFQTSEDENWIPASRQPQALEPKRKPGKKSRDADDDPTESRKRTKRRVKKSLSIVQERKEAEVEGDVEDGREEEDEVEEYFEEEEGQQRLEGDESDTNRGCWAQGCPGGPICEQEGHLREQFWLGDDHIVTQADVDYHRYRMKKAMKKKRNRWHWHL